MALEERDGRLQEGKKDQTALQARDPESLADPGHLHVLVHHRDYQDEDVPGGEEAKAGKGPLPGSRAEPGKGHDKNGAIEDPINRAKGVEASSSAQQGQEAAKGKDCPEDATACTGQGDSPEVAGFVVDVWIRHEGPTRAPTGSRVKRATRTGQTKIVNKLSFMLASRRCIRQIPLPY